MEERLRPAEADVPDEWRRYATPETPYPAECFYRSYRYTIDLYLGLPEEDELGKDGAGIWLVHGQYLLSFRHAWVELPGDIVFDGVHQRFYSGGAYRTLQSARAWYKYMSMAAGLLACNVNRDAGEA